MDLAFYSVFLLAKQIESLFEVNIFSMHGKSALIPTRKQHWAEGIWSDLRFKGSVRPHYNKTWWYLTMLMGLVSFVQILRYTVCTWDFWRHTRTMDHCVLVPIIPVHSRTLGKTRDGAMVQWNMTEKWVWQNRRTVPDSVSICLTILA